MKLTTTIDVQLGRGLNDRENRFTRAKRVKAEREATHDALMDHVDAPAFVDVLVDGEASLTHGARITLHRPWARVPLDSDNLSGAFKGVRDEVAAFLGVDDKSERLHWIYTQSKQPKGTRPTVTIEVIPVADIDPQVKRVRELEDKLRRVEDKLSHVRSVTSKRGSDYEMRIAELEECLKAWENFVYVNERLGRELPLGLQSITVETRALLAKCVTVDLEALLTSSK